MDNCRIGYLSEEGLCKTDEEPCQREKCNQFVETMNELKVCPFPKECKYCEFCWQGNDDEFCCLKGHSGKLDCDGDEFELDGNCKAALSRTQPENKTLSLEELRQMDGEPVWLPELKEWAIVTIDTNGRFAGMPFVQGRNFNYDVKARKLICYRRKPEQEEK